MTQEGVGQSAVEQARKRVVDWFEGLSARERWLLVLGASAIALYVVMTSIVQPLGEATERAQRQALQLDTDLIRARRLAAEVRNLQGDLGVVEARIVTSAKTNLLALLERLAAESKIDKEQLESITPKPVSSHPAYPETRVEVRLKGTTLERAVQFLHKIENAESHLIIRSLRVTRQPTRNKTDLLEVSFSVSSFERV